MRYIVKKIRKYCERQPKLPDLLTYEIDAVFKVVGDWDEPGSVFPQPKFFKVVQEDKYISGFH